MTRLTASDCVIGLDVDFGSLDRSIQIASLKELIETMPDKDIANVILELGTQELADRLEDWVNDTVNEGIDGTEEVQSEEAGDGSSASDDGEPE